MELTLISYQRLHSHSCSIDSTLEQLQSFLKQLAVFSILTQVRFTTMEADM